jgi:hypothetical protein
LLLGLLALTIQDAEAQFADATSSEATASGDAAGGQSSTLLTAEELNALVAPVALYPDELLAIVLPASTNPIQVIEAQRFLDQRAKDANLQPNEEWDPSVLALINYPEALKKLSDDISWCQDLGNAVLDQQDDVLNAIQAARGSASDAGYLQSNDQVTVINEGDNITVESKDPEVIYVPQYDPAPVVYNNYTNYPPPYYSDPYPPYWAPAATFFTGMFVGAAFSYGFDWDNGDIDIDNDINIDNSRGDVNVDRGDRTNIGSGNRGDRENRFNGERKAGSTDKMKWSGQKARQKSSATRRTPDAKRPNSANIQRQLGQGGSGQLQGNQKLKNNKAARNQSSRGNQSLKQNNKNTQQLRKNNANKQQMRNQQQRQKQPQQRQMQNRSNKGGGAFAGQGNQRTKQNSARGNKSMNRPKGGGGKPSRPPRASGGRR